MDGGWPRLSKAINIQKHRITLTPTNKKRRGTAHFAALAKCALLHSNHAAMDAKPGP